MKRIYFLFLLLTAFCLSPSPVFADNGSNNDAYIKISNDTTVKVKIGDNNNVEMKLFKGEIYYSKFKEEVKEEANINGSDISFTVDKGKYELISNVKTIDNENIKKCITKQFVSEKFIYFFNIKMFLEELKILEIKPSKVSIATLLYNENINIQNSDDKYSVKTGIEEDFIRLICDGFPTIFVNTKDIILTYDEQQYEKITTNYGATFVKDKTKNFYYYNTGDILTEAQKLSPGKYELDDNKFLFIDDNGKGIVKTQYVKLSDIIIYFCIAILLIGMIVIWNLINKKIQPFNNIIDKRSTDITDLKKRIDYIEKGDEYNKVTREIKNLKDENRRLTEELTNANEQLNKKTTELSKFEELSSKIFPISDHNQFIENHQKFLTNLKETEQRIMKIYSKHLSYPEKYKKEIIVFSQILSKFYSQKKHIKLSKWESILKLIKTNSFIADHDVVKGLKNETPGNTIKRLEILLFDEVYKNYIKSLVLLLEEAKYLNTFTEKEPQIEGTPQIINEYNKDQQDIIVDAKKLVEIEIKYASLFTSDDTYRGIIEAVGEEKIGNLYSELKNKIPKNRIVEITSYGLKYKDSLDDKTECIINL